LRHDPGIFGVPRERQGHDDEEFDRTDQEKLVDLVFSVDRKERPSGFSPRKGFVGVRFGVAAVRSRRGGRSRRRCGRRAFRGLGFRSFVDRGGSVPAVGSSITASVRSRSSPVFFQQLLNPIRNRMEALKIVDELS